MKFQPIVFFLAFVFIILPGCKSNPASVQGGSIQDIFPLKVGDSWTYRQTDFNPIDSTQNVSTGSISVDSEETYHGFHAYHYILDTLQEISHVLLYFSGSDLYSVDVNDSTSTPQVVLHYPMSIGESRIHDSIIQGTTIRKTVTLIQNAEPITTLAGAFQTVHFQTVDAYIFQTIIDTSSIADNYYAQGVGMVLSKNYGYMNRKPYLGRTIELQSYVVK
jgi:hypothetical protein